MAFYVGGTAGMRNMGTYAAGTTYFPNDLVQYLGSSYIATVTTTGNLPTDTNYWGVLASGASASGGVTDTLFATNYQVGFWYSRRNSNPYASAQYPSLFQASTSTIYYVPFIAYKALTIDQWTMCSYSSTAPSSGAAVRVGVYAVTTGTNAPGALLSDWGLCTLPTTVSTFGSTQSGTFAIPKGLSYMAFSFNSTSAGFLLGLHPNNGEYVASQGLNAATFSAAYVNGNGAMGAAYFQQTGNATAAALTTPASATAQYVSGGIQQPDIFFRISAAT